jgi:hypothetical protein
MYFLILAFVPATWLAHRTLGPGITYQLLAVSLLAAPMICGGIVKNFPCPRCQKPSGYVTWKERRSRRHVPDPWATRPRTLLGRFLAYGFPLACLHCGFSLVPTTRRA